MALKKKRKAATLAEKASDLTVESPKGKKRKKTTDKATVSIDKVEQLSTTEASAEAVAIEPAGPRKKKKRPLLAPSEDDAEDVEAEEAVDSEVAPMSRGIKKRLKAKKKKMAEEPAPAVEEDTADGEEHTVFVDGVPYTWEVVKIHEIFNKCGQVLDVRAPTWQDSGRLRGFAHVSFATKEAKNEALKMSGIKVGAKGRFLKIDSAKKPDDGKSVPTQDLTGKRRLFVKNLPYDATESDIKKLFGKFGKIADVRIPMSFGRSKGFAYVEFARPETLKEAVEAGAELSGRTLVLDADSGQGPKAGFHYRASEIQQRPESWGSGGGRGGKGGKDGKGKKGGGKGDGKDGGKGGGKGFGKSKGRGHGPTMSLF